MRIASALGYAYALAGHVAEAFPLLERVLEEAERAGCLAAQAFCVTWRSEASLVAGHREEVCASAPRALARTPQGRGHEAWALRLLGERAAQCHPLGGEPAEAPYRQALALADALGMRPLQAHGHLSLGTLYATTGQREQARAELSTAIAIYRAMAMTFWLPQAAVVLAHGEERYRPGWCLVRRKAV